MTPRGGSHPYSTMAKANRGRRIARGRRREATTRRAFDGIVASYIRDISGRTTPSADQALS